MYRASRGGVVRSTSQTRSDSTVTVYLPEYVRGSGAAASAGGAGGAEALTEGFVDPASSTTVASWITISSLSFLHSKRLFLQRQHQQNAMMVRPPPVRETTDHPLAQGMKFPLVFDSGSGSGSFSGPGSVGFGDGLYVVGPSAGVKTGLAVGLPGVAVGAGVGLGVGLGDGLDVGGSVGLGDGATDGL